MYIFFSIVGDNITVAGSTYVCNKPPSNEKQKTKKRRRKLVRLTEIQHFNTSVMND